MRFAFLVPEIAVARSTPERDERNACVENSGVFTPLSVDHINLADARPQQLLQWDIEDKGTRATASTGRTSENVLNS
jgi:hypothetical protein